MLTSTFLQALPSKPTPKPGVSHASLTGRGAIGINYKENPDEYRPEAQTITLRRREARSVEDVRRIVHEEFVHWFGGETAGSPQSYQSIADEIWVGWSLSDNEGRTLGD